MSETDLTFFFLLGIWIAISIGSIGSGLKDIAKELKRQNNREAALHHREGLDY